MDQLIAKIAKIAGGPDAKRLRFLTFLCTSGFSAILNILARSVFSNVFSYEISVALAYGVGVITAFTLARIFVFGNATGNLHGQFIRFVLVNLVGFAQVWAVSVGLFRVVLPAIGIFRHADVISHVLGIASLTATSFFLHRRFSFPTRKAGTRAILADQGISK
jgi:putative flippase GtrA